ncbi:MAG TPA: emp24/gp25L/p24 family protein [Terriglobales bacterium]|nr:emp24/gp25L/p24 family protein [Terriglobales bacterium]
MLTPEERQRIEEEERKRIAEEHFRAEVRAKLQGDSAPPVRKPAGRLPWIIGLAAALVIGTIVLMNNKGQSRTGDDSGTTAQAASNVAKTRYVPVSQKIATGQIVVRANGYVQYRITITPEMIGPTVTGNFNASGGSGNDIQAVIADEENYTNWINGHQAQAFWTTQGKQTTGNIEATLKPGMYYLAFSNKFSAFTEKQVFLDVDLNYKKAETYH